MMWSFSTVILAIIGGHSSVTIFIHSLKVSKFNLYLFKGLLRTVFDIWMECSSEIYGLANRGSR